MKLQDMTPAELVQLEGGGSFDEFNRNVGRAVGWIVAATQYYGGKVLGGLGQGSNLAMSPTGMWYRTH